MSTITLPAGTKDDPFTWGYFYDSSVCGPRLFASEEEVKRYTGADCYLGLDRSAPALVALVEKKTRERKVYAIIDSRKFGPYGEIYCPNERLLLLNRRRHESTRIA